MSQHSASPAMRVQFGALWGATVISLIGDQVGRVALSVLVFRATDSVAATGAAYAVTFVPGLAGAVTGLLADQHPRRTVLVVCDLLRAGLFTLMGFSITPAWAVCVLFAGAVLVSGPFNAAATATVADLFAGDTFRRANASRLAGGQAAQILGFAVGGVAVAAIGARGAFLIDAFSFLASAVALRFGLARRPAARMVGGEKPLPFAHAGAILRAPLQARRLGYIALVGFWIVPESLAAPVAAHLGYGTGWVGILLAAMPAGYVVSSLIVARLPAGPARRLAAPLAIATGLPLIGTALDIPIGVIAALWVITGACTGYLTIVLADYIADTDPAHRGQAAGLSSATGLVTQGLGAAGGGLVGQFANAATAVATAGAAGLVVALIITVARGRPANHTDEEENVRPAAAPATSESGERH